MHWAEGLLERGIERTDRGFVASSWHFAGPGEVLERLKFRRKSPPAAALFRFYSSMVDKMIDDALTPSALAIRIVAPKDSPSTIFAFYVVEPTCQLVYRHIHHKLRPKVKSDLDAVESMLNAAAASWLRIPVRSLVSTWHPMSGVPFQPGMVHREFERIRTNAAGTRTAQG